VLIHRIFISDHQYKSEIKATNAFRNVKQKSSAVIDLLGKKIQEFLNGKAQKFDQTLLDFSICSPLQKDILEAEAKIPRGRVSTYKRIAIAINHPKSARVVGNALAKNPFPIIIPCHRAIKSNGEIGGFQGGNAMKRKLLEFEGIKFADNGKVLLDNIYY
jgi:methylated-DNA-[protein]-cysteine S-methyltransferase